MKTVVIRDIIEKVATPEQLQNLHGALTPFQYYDLMMNNGTDTATSDDIAVLSKEHEGSKEYMKALLEHVGKTRKFWENANALVKAINENINEAERKKFSRISRIIDDKLIDMIENGVPSNEDALNCVTEDIIDADNLLSLIANNYLEDDCWKPCELSIDGVPTAVRVGMHITQYCLSFQSPSTLVINILKEFRNQGTTEINLDSTFLGKYVEQSTYYGNLETDLLATTFTIAKAKSDMTKTMCQHMFLEASGVRYREESDKPVSLPDVVIIKMHPDAWRTLIAKCTVK